jgi:endonuclease I
MKKFYMILLAGLIFNTLLQAQIPNGYYNSAAGLEGTALRAALHNIIDNHTSLSYGDIYDILDQTDQKSNGKVWDMYSDIPGGTPPYEYTFFTNECGNYNSEGDCYNKEHSWPKSWFGGEVYPMYSDLFQIVPTDGWVNNKRSNYPYGEVGSASWTSLNGSKLGSCNVSGYSGTVFEPIDEYKGDFARGYFYMSTRYYNEDSGWPGSDMVDGADIKPWALAMLLQWHYNDPVSTKETNRCNAVYQLQNNRNPFIDHPEYAAYIWDPESAVDELSFENRFHIYFSDNRQLLHINALEVGHLGDNELKVFSLTGQVIFSDEISTTNYELNVSSLASGCYVVQIVEKESQQLFHSKIIK